MPSWILIVLAHLNKSAGRLVAPLGHVFLNLRPVLIKEKTIKLVFTGSTLNMQHKGVKTGLRFRKTCPSGATSHDRKY
jgi:hypothetical protein